MTHQRCIQMNPLADRCQWLTCRRHFSISVKFDSNASHRWRWQRRSFQGAPARRYRINYRYIRGEGRGGGGGGKEKDNKYRLLEPTLGVFKWPCSGGLEKGKEELGTCSLILLCRGIHQVLLFGRPSTTAHRRCRRTFNWERGAFSPVTLAYRYTS